MKSLFAAIAAAAMLGACTVTSVTTDEPALSTADRAVESAAITAMLTAQDEDWNRGDIEAFMEGYWKSPDLRFASGGSVTRGWQATLDRYKTRYDSREKMGRLLTSDYEIVVLSPDAAIAHGRWALEREGDDPHGLYTLVLRKIDGDWVIISDTTTSAD